MKLRAFYTSDDPREEGQHVITVVVPLSHHEHIQLLAVMKNHEFDIEVSDGRTEK